MVKKEVEVVANTMTEISKIFISLFSRLIHKNLLITKILIMQSYLRIYTCEQYQLKA